MIARSTRLILIADTSILLMNVVSSLIGARALGPAGRGNLLLVVLWPPIIAMVAGLGLPMAHRYWMAREPQRVSSLFSNAVVYTAIVGIIAVVLADLLVPSLVGERSAEVKLLLRIYQINIPAALFLDLMRGLLEGTRRFGWAGAARLVFFGIQALGFALLWSLGHLTVSSATFTLIAAQTSSMMVALVAVLSQLRPHWDPSWQDFKISMNYGLRDYPGGLADYTTLRLDQLMLGAMASNVAIGLYVVAVRLSEVTTTAAEAIGDALIPEVASTKAPEKAETLWARSLRFTIYLHVVLIVPLWFGAPYILRLLFGEKFVPATGAFRWLLLAAALWGFGSIVISGLRGFGHPGLGAVARFSAAVVTAISLVILLPRLGITGAAIASLIGYSVMSLVAFVSFTRKRKLRWSDCLKPRREDIVFADWRTVHAFVFAKPASAGVARPKIGDELA